MLYPVPIMTASQNLQTDQEVERRMLQRQNESLPWKPLIQQTHQPHDEATVDIQRDNYFTPNQFPKSESLL